MKSKILILFVLAFTVLLTMVAAQAFFEPKVIYGKDNRIDVYQVNNSAIYALTQSTVAIIHKDSIRQKNQSFGIKGSRFGDTYGLCKDEPFYYQPISANCSGFLVDKNKIATAGHCIDKKSCGDYRFVFSFEMGQRGRVNMELPRENLYFCKRIIKREYTGKQDYALVELDRNVEGRTPLKINTRDDLKVGAKLLVIGHPAGLPTKVAAGSNVRVFKESRSFFKANLDTYGGNSGSAVFNAVTHEVEGILVRGETDFVYDDKNQCARSNICSQNGCRGEDVSNIRYIADELK